MRINFKEIEPLTVPGMNGGTGTMAARMHDGGLHLFLLVDRL